MEMSESPLQDPDVEQGITYWANQSPNYNGVLGGFGNGSLPRVDALGSRQFTMHLMPELCTVPSAIRPIKPSRDPNTRIRALDVGAGVGRVTGDVLLHLVSDVVLVEPVESLVNEALARGKGSELGNHDESKEHEPWKGIADKSKSVSFIQATLQDFDPAWPLFSTKLLGRVGYQPPEDDLDAPYDIIWCQWCLGCLSDQDLVTFLRRARAALRDTEDSFIFVKENCCSEPDGVAKTVYDDEDSSLTRSDLAWKKIFDDAGLSLVYSRHQEGFPRELYSVMMYALR